MIFSLFLNFFYMIIAAGIRQFPDINGDNPLVTTMTTVNGYVGVIHSIIPYITVTLIAILGFEVIFEGTYFAFKLFYWILKRFPTQS